MGKPIRMIVLRCVCVWESDNTQTIGKGVPPFSWGGKFWGGRSLSFCDMFVAETWCKWKYNERGMFKLSDAFSFDP